MMMAQVSTDQIAEGFGLPAAIVIVALITVILYLVRQNDTKQRKIDELQETRISDANKVGDKIIAPMEDVKEINGKMYDLLLNLTNNKRSR